MTNRLREAAQAALSAMDDMATDSRCADMPTSRTSEFDAAREDLRDALAEQDHSRDATEMIEASDAIEVAYFMGRADGRRAALAEQEAEQIAIGPEWTPCTKRPVTVHVRSQRDGESHSSTREGITPVKADDLIMRGVDGEEYPIGRDLFNRTYIVGAARIKAIKQDAEPVARAVEVAAMILSDCGCSTDNESLLMRVAVRISKEIDK